MDHIANKADTTSFTCHATGEPVPTISWYFNNIMVTRSTKYEFFDVSSMQDLISILLVIRNVQSSDVGTYTCNVTNIVSSDTSSGVLTVNGEDYFIM